jgi:TPR repeat protein
VTPVYIELVDANKAIAACTAAIGRYPNFPRFFMELGRSFAAKMDYKKAVYYYQKASDMGSRFAIIELANAYLAGSGVRKDSQTAARLFAKSADLGDVAGLTGLALRYEIGDTVDQDLTKANAMLTKAAEAGSLEAMSDLGDLYMSSHYNDYKSAFAWYSKAADAGFRNGIAGLASVHEIRGTAEDLAEASRLYEIAESKGQPKCWTISGTKFCQ